MTEQELRETIDVAWLRAKGRLGAAEVEAFQRSMYEIGHDGIVEG